MQVLAIILSVVIFSASIYAWSSLAHIRRVSTRTEYTGHYITKLKYYEPWDELVTVRKTRQVQKGVDSNGNPIMEEEAYYEDEIHYHEAAFYMVLNSGKTIEISRGQYSMYNKVMVSKDIYINLHRNYYSINGNMYLNEWDGRIFTLVPITMTEKYTNPVLATESVFNTSEITPEEAMNMGLYDYPAIVDHQQRTIIGKEFDEIDERYYNHANVMISERNGMRVYLLFFKDKPIEIAEQQKNYWKNGNRNEVVLCVGIDSQTDDIQWCHTFSWCDDKSFETKCKQWLVTCKCFDLRVFAKFMLDNAECIIMKDFSDFEYLLMKKKGTLKIIGISTIIVASVLLLIGMLAF